MRYFSLCPRSSLTFDLAEDQTETVRNASIEIDLSMSIETNSVIVWYEIMALNNNTPLSHLLLDSGSDEKFLVYSWDPADFLHRLLYMAAALVLFGLRESCCYVAILSMKALRPRFHATSVFFLESVHFFFRLSWYFKREESVFWKASFLQNNNWFRVTGMISSFNQGHNIEFWVVSRES